MKKTFRFFVSAIAVMAALASCVKNEVKVSPEDKTKTVEITASYSDTKTALEDGRYVRWSATDAVKAFGLEQTGYVSKTTEVSEEGSVATFTFDISEDEILYLAYPAANCGSMDGGGNIYFTIPSQQTAVANGFADGANVAIGEIMDGTAKMYNAGALVSFEVKNDDITSIKLEFENAVNAVTGSGYAYYEDKTVLSQGDAINGTAAFNYVEIKAAEAQALEKGAKYYAVVYPGTYEGMTLTFTRNDGAIATFTNSAGLKLAENSNITVFKSEIPADKWVSGAAPEITVSMDSFSAISGYVGGDANASYEAAKGDAQTAPALNSGEIRVYQNGGLFTVTSADGYKLKSVTIGSSMSTSINYKLDDGDEVLSSNAPIQANGTYKVDNLKNKSIQFICKGTDKNHRLYVNYLSVTYIENSGPVAVESVTLNHQTMSLAVGETGTLIATVVPEDATNKNVTWNSDNESVATVDENGTVTAVAEGEAIITVTTEDGGFTVSCTVTVEEKASIEYEGSGTEEDPYTVDDAYKLIDSLGSASSDEVCVKGTVYKIDNYNSTYHSLTYWIGSEDKPLEVYSGKNLDNTDFSSVNDLNIGDELVVKGHLKKYNAIYEFDYNSWIVSRIEAPKYEITFASMTNGSVTADVESAAAFREVTLTVSPDAGYKLSSLSVATVGGADVELTGNKFIMPASDVIVSAAFEEAVGEPIPATTPCYTLTSSTKGTNSSYDGNCDITIDGITWNITGNTQMNPWRIGGKSLSNKERAVYSKTAYYKALSKVTLSVGAASSITINSIKLIYSTNSDFSNSTELIASTTAANSVIEFAPEGGFPANGYYKFVFNVSVSVSSNKFVEFKEVNFYGYIE